MYFNFSKLEKLIESIKDNCPDVKICVGGYYFNTNDVKLNCDFIGNDLESFRKFLGEI